MKNALLLRFGGLGDLLVTLPALRAVRALFSSARLTLACREEYGAVFKETGIVDAIISKDSPRLLALYKGRSTSAGGAAERLADFDLILGWMQKESANFVGASLFPGEGSARFHLIRDIPGRSERLSDFFFHQTLKVLKVDRPRAVSFEEYARLPLKPQHSARGLGLVGNGERKGRLVVVHPGSGSETKRWPLDRFLEVIGRLRHWGISGALVTGEAEEEMDAILGKTGLPLGWTWIRRPPLVALAGLLQEARLYLGNDSGVTHLAAACGTDVVALFRRDLIDSWRPVGRVHLLFAERVDGIRVESLWETITGLLGF